MADWHTLRIMQESDANLNTSSAVALPSPGNPDGKGLSGLMLDWSSTEPRGVVAKPQRQVLAEFFTSMLVLSASFKYKPAVGSANFLYWVNDSWNLSLIDPQEWSTERQQGYVGRCSLQQDMTWTIEPSQELLDGGPLANAVSRFFDVFADTLDKDLPLEDILPFYVRQMPYWQRMHASGLSRSIQAALTLGDQTGTSARAWRTNLLTSNPAATSLLTR